MQKLLYLLITLLGILHLNSCDVSEEMIPGYIYVPSVNLLTDISIEGTNSSKITDVYCYVDGKFLGIYALPAMIPVLEEGEKEVQLFAGVRPDGINNASDDYPFFTKKTINIDFQPKKIDTISYTTRYTSQSNFIFEPEVGFEGSNLVFEADIDGTASNGLELSDEDVFEGEFSGKIYGAREDGAIEIGSVPIIGIPDINGETYLELNYKTNMPFFIGVIGYNGSNIAVKYYNKGINTKEDWNKIYINLDEEMSALRNEIQNISYYRIAFLVDFSVVTGITEADIHLDNIKLIQTRQ